MHTHAAALSSAATTAPTAASTAMRTVLLPLVAGFPACGGGGCTATGARVLLSPLGGGGGLVPTGGLPGAGLSTSGWFAGLSEGPSKACTGGAGDGLARGLAGGGLGERLAGRAGELGGCGGGVLGEGLGVDGEGTGVGEAGAGELAVTGGGEGNAGEGDGRGEGGGDGLKGTPACIGRGHDRVGLSQQLVIPLPEHAS